VKLLASIALTVLLSSCADTIFKATIGWDKASVGVEIYRPKKPKPVEPPLPIGEGRDKTPALVDPAP